MEVPISDLSFLIFIIPGFITVWSFRYFTKSKKTGDFEFLGLSFFWGLATLFLTFLYFKFLGSQEEFQKVLENPYAAAFALSLFGFIFGWVGGVLSKEKCFQKIVDQFKGF